MASDGQTRYRALLDGGLSTVQADEWKNQATEALRSGGLEENKIAEYWGETAPNLAAEVNDFKTRHDINVPPANRVAGNLQEYWEAGTDQGVAGLVIGRPDIAMPENPGIVGATVAMAGQVVSDAPATLPGIFGGAAIGGGIGFALGGPPGAAVGASLGAMYGGGFLPGYLRSSLEARYPQPGEAPGSGEITTAAEYVALLQKNVLQGHKEGAINAITGRIGGEVGEKVLKATASKVGATLSNLLTQATSGTALAAGIEGRIPNWEDFGAAAALVVGLQAGYSVVSQVPNARIHLNAAGRVVEGNLRDLYVRTGMLPDAARARAETDPHFRAGLMGRMADNDVTVEGVASRRLLNEMWAAEDAKQKAVIDNGPMDAADAIEYVSYLRKRAEAEAQVANKPLTADDLSVIRERGYEVPEHDIDMPPDMEGMATSGRDRAGEFLDRIAGTVFKQGAEGGLVPDQTGIASYLQKFGRLAGFNFIVGRPETVSAQFNPNGLESPHYHTKRKSVFIPDTPEELNRRWYGLGRYEIIHHEVGHAIDYALGRLHTEAFEPRVDLDVEGGLSRGPIFAEALAASLAYRPQLWKMAPEHNMKPSELMADAIATWITNPTFRPHMKEFGKKYGKLLEPYVAMADNNLPKRTENGWVPPGDETPAGSAGGRGGSPAPPGGGRPPPPDYATVFPPDDGIRPRIEDDSIHLSLSLRIDRFLEGRIGKRPEAGWRNLFNPRVLYRQFVTELAAGRGADRDFKIKPTDLGIEDMLRQTYASSSRARYFMRYGGLDAITLEPTGAPSYLSAYDVVREAGGNLKDFEGYRVAARVVELTDRGGTVPRGIETGFNIDEARIIVREGAAKYEAANRTVNEAKNSVIDYARDSGFFSEAGAQAIKDMNMSHIMFRRIMDPTYNPAYMGKQRGFNTKLPVRRIEGSERMILTPTLADIENLHFLVAMADRNRAVGAVVGRIEQISAEMAAAGLDTKTTMLRIEDANKPRFEVLDEDGNVIYDSRTSPKLGGKNSPADDNPFDGIAVQRSIDPHRNPGQFIYYRNGVAELWETNDPELARLLRAPGDAPEMNFAVAIMQGFAKFARLGIITAPDFPVRSIMRGEISRAINMPYGGAPFGSFFQALYHVMRETPEYRDAVAKGATGGSFLSMDMKPMLEDINSTFEKTQTYSNAWNFFRHPIDAMRAFQDRLYTAQAVGYYRNLKKRGIYGSDLKAGSEARKSSIDVSEKAGSAAVNTLHRSSLFLRTSTLDLAQFGRAMRERPFSTGLAITTAVLIPTVLNWIGNQYYDSLWETDADFRAANPAYVPYREIPRWQKENHYVLPPIGGFRARLPLKPYGIGGFLGALVERSLDHFILNDPRAYKDWEQSFIALVVPSFIPAIGMPAYETWGNTRTVSGAPLVPANMEGVSGYMRYTPDTTATAKAISRFLSPDVGILSRFDIGAPQWLSPVVIDNLARGWAGPVPVEIFKALEMPFKPRAHPWTIADVPVVKSFIARHPGASAQSIRDFYDALATVEQKGNDWFLAVRRRNVSEMKEIGLNPQAFLRLSEMRTAISGMSAAIDGFNQSTKLTNDEKLHKIDATYASMITLSKTGLKIMDAAKKRRP